MSRFVPFHKTNSQSSLSDSSLSLSAPIPEYSESLFSQAECSVSISESFLADADAKDYCFVENTSVAEFKEKISRLVIYKWNRDYPADFYFDIDYASDYKLETTLDFGGTSHEKITKEVYVR